MFSGADIRKIRIIADLTAKQLGELTGYSRGYICLLEADKFHVSDRFMKSLYCNLLNSEDFKTKFNRLIQEVNQEVKNAESYI